MVEVYHARRRFSCLAADQVHPIAVFAVAQGQGHGHAGKLCGGLAVMMLSACLSFNVLTYGRGEPWKLR
jgi:hypothetical protein